MKTIFLMLMAVLSFEAATAQNNAVQPVSPAPADRNNVPKTTDNYYDANSNSHYNSVREIRNKKAQPTNAGDQPAPLNDSGNNASGSATSPGTGSNRAAGNISSGNVSDPTLTNSGKPDNTNNNPRP